MLLNFDPSLATALGVLFFWVVALTVLFVGLYRHYRRLAGKTQAGDLKETLEIILSSQQNQQKDLKKLASLQAKMQKDAHSHFQHFGLVRYNPFSDTGGDQSFVIALLDDLGQGFVITSLHSRDATRVFAKPIKAGKSGPYDLSKEEEKAVNQALKN